MIFVFAHVSIFNIETNYYELQIKLKLITCQGLIQADLDIGIPLLGTSNLGAQNVVKFFFIYFFYFIILFFYFKCNSLFLAY